MARKGQTMTRYSHNPLAKKFKCPECDNWFRTLQGLSGHIRFRHGDHAKEEDMVARMKGIEANKMILTAFCQGMGVSRETIEARLRVLDTWAGFLIYCKSFGLTLGIEDFKNYVIDNFWRELAARK